MNPNPMLENKLGITNQVDLARVEEQLSKHKAKQLWELGDMQRIQVGTFAGLSAIHAYLFADIYDFAGKLREVNIAKGNFRFAPVLYLQAALQQIDAMPQENFTQIIEKYVEMNVAHPFREGNGRTTRIWLDLILKQQLQQVIDWNQVDRTAYLNAMQLSPIDDQPLKQLLASALTPNIHDRALYMRGIDVSYFYEGYGQFKTEEL